MIYSRRRTHFSKVSEWGIASLHDLNISQPLLLPNISEWDVKFWPTCISPNVTYMISGDIHGNQQRFLAKNVCHADENCLNYVWQTTKHDIKCLTWVMSLLSHWHACLIWAVHQHVPCTFFGHPCMLPARAVMWGPFDVHDHPLTNSQ